MSDYKRFVSYMYEYRKHEKGANRGFIKVECRNGFCQMNFALKGLCRDGNGVADIYGFRRKGEALEGSLLETVQVQGGTLNPGLRFRADRMGDKNYSMEELAGIIILCGNDFLYATQWDDEPMNFQGFPNRADAEAKSETTIQEPETNTSAETEVPLKTAMQLSPENVKSIADSPNILSENNNTLSNVPMKNSNSTSDAPAKGSNTVSYIPTENSNVFSNAAKENEHTPSDLPVKNSNISSNTSQENDNTLSNMPVENSNTLSNMLQKNNNDSLNDASASSADIHATSTESESSASQNRPYFRDGSIVNCVKITPKDLGRLHSKDWHLTNNRFIHYGYQMFGHLLVGQLADSGQTVLCVPGSYHQKECFMANMFGFSQFIRCPGHKNYPRCFGYWYRSIQPTNLNRGNGPS